MKLKKLNKKGKILTISSICIVIAGFILLFSFMKTSAVEFKDKIATVEIHNKYDAQDFISQVNGYDKSDIKIDDSQVDINKLGKYEIKYKINNKEYILEVDVVDKTAPTYTVQNLQLALGSEIKAEYFTKDINDQTQTKVYFSNEYKFDHEGEYKVNIIVEDEGGNKTEKEATLKVIKDTEKPTLYGLKNYDVIVGSQIDYLKGITAKDNLDSKPKIEVNSQNVDLKKAGKYNVIYTVSDQTGNKNVYTKTVTVREKQNIASVPANGSKIMYLTFDDGPSANTAKILDILDKYGAKATFFVTGTGQKYNDF